jgi:replication factor C subunit 2/4
MSKSTNVKVINNNIPWIEKYRPRTIEELILDDQLLLKIKKFIADKEMPNIIITGSPGVGKTTTIKCIAKGLLGKHANNAVLELNASDDRGIKAVQDTIMNFCKRKLDLNEDSNVKLFAEHKIIILDEADNMTENAQAQINNLMEKYHDTTRFAMTCNNSQYIKESIQSRCIILRYKKLTNLQIIERLKFICSKENISYQPKALETLAFISQGDIRCAINNLQRAYFGTDIKQQLTSDMIFTICDRPQPVVIQELFNHCKNKNFIEAHKIADKLHACGFSDYDIILGMLNILRLSDIVLEESVKIKFAEVIGKSAIIVSKGLDNSVQLSACIANMILTL